MGATSEVGHVGLRAMPEYRSVKTVYALKIRKIHRSTVDIELAFEEDGYANKIITNHELEGKPNPQDGWYFVRYTDGYFSFSPGPQFEAGNVLKSEWLEKASRAAQEANFQLCVAIGDPADHWDDAPEILKQSVRTGVMGIIANPSITSEESHQKWLDYKRAEGWKYGPVKDVEKKEHPCFLPYSQLPINQRLKDHLFGIVVRAALNL